MDNFVIIGRSPLDPIASSICNLTCKENQAVETADKMHNTLGLRSTIVVDKNFNVVYRVKRVCSCKNIQHDFIDDAWKCVDCGITICSILETKEEMVG